MAVAASPPGLGTPVDIEDDPAVHIGRADCDELPLGAPRRLTGALEVQPGIGLCPDRAPLACGAIQSRVAGMRLEQRGEHFAIGIEHRDKSGWVSEPAP